MHTVITEELTTEEANRVLKDVISYVLAESTREFDDLTVFQCQFVRYMIGFVTPDEESAFFTKSNLFWNRAKNRWDKIFHMSKQFSRFLRHEQSKTHLFDQRGMVELAAFFDEIWHSSPLREGMSGMEFAAMFYGNDKARFHIDIHVSGVWSRHKKPPVFDWSSTGPHERCAESS